jgi:hypothetical protein
MSEPVCGLSVTLGLIVAYKNQFLIHHNKETAIQGFTLMTLARADTGTHTPFITMKKPSNPAHQYQRVHQALG